MMRRQSDPTPAHNMALMRILVHILMKPAEKMDWHRRYSSWSKCWLNATDSYFDRELRNKVQTEKS